MAKIKTNTNALVEGDLLAREGNTFVVGGNLEVDGNITKGGEPLSGGTQLYLHEVTDLAGNNFKVVTTSSETISDIRRVQNVLSLKYENNNYWTDLFMSPDGTSMFILAPSPSGVSPVPVSWAPVQSDTITPL